jgi:AP-1-like factor
LILSRNIVPQLEDKVAELEAKNVNAETENLHLKELLKRVQDENVSLRNTSFTFSVPRNGEPSDTPFSGALSSFDSPPASIFASTSHLPSPSSSAPKAATPQPSSLDIPSAFPADIDFGTLTSLDSESLSLLDDSDAIMSYDFGYGQFVPSKTPYKTIASNPMFMSFAEPTADTTPTSSGSSPYDVTFGQWTGQTSSQEGNVHAGSIDELFGGHIFGSQSPLNFNVLMKSPVTSPIAPTAPASSPVIHQSMHTLSSSASPIVSTVFESSEESSPAASSSGNGMCPKTRAQMEQKIQAEGSSMFAPPPPQEEEPQNQVFTLPTGADGHMVMCKEGVTFPRTEKSDKNIEVLTAWQNITSHPQFKASVSSSLHS